MNACERTAKIITGASIGVGAGVAKVLERLIVSQTGVGASLGVLLFLGLLVFITQVARFCLEFAVERSAMLRRLLLGNQFIDGTWIDVVWDGDTPFAIGYIEILSDGTKTKFSGENTDWKGDNLGEFESTMSTVDWPKLRYNYVDRSQGSLREKFREGYGQLNFRCDGGVAYRYSGSFTDLSNGSHFKLEGWRIRDRETLASLRVPETRLRTVLATAAAIAKHARTRDANTITAEPPATPA